MTRPTPSLVAERNRREAGTAGAALDALADQLRDAGLTESRLKAELLLSHVLACPRLDLALRSSESCSDAQRARLDAFAARAIRREPIQYILGEVNFRGQVLAVDRRALIPRPETEWLVERALLCADVWGKPHPVVYDVGTGSGCIALSLALAHPHARIHAVDVRAEALALAIENGQRVFHRRCPVDFVENNLLAGVPPGTADLVVSNPPYLSTAEYGELADEIRLFEPRDALDGGSDGLAVLRVLAKQAFRALRPGGRLLLEMGATHGERLDRLLRNEGYVETCMDRDLAGRERIAGGRTP